MKQLNHTNSPWSEKGIYTAIRFAHKHDFVDTSGEEGIMPYSEADAKLISQAPEMLGALIEVVKFYRCVDEIEYIVDHRIKPLIERATGMKIEEVIE